MLSVTLANFVGTPTEPIPFEKLGEGADDAIFDKIVVGDTEPFEVKHGEEHLSNLYARSAHRAALSNPFFFWALNVIFVTVYWSQDLKAYHCQSQTAQGFFDKTNVFQSHSDIHATGLGFQNTTKRLMSIWS